MSEVDQQERITLPILDAFTMSAASRQALADVKAMADEIARVELEEVTAENVLDAWDRMNIHLEEVLGPASILGSVHPGRTVRDRADDALLEATKFTTELFQDARLYERVRRVEPRNQAERQMQKDLVEAFEDSGVSLPEERRKRVREIVAEIEQLNQDFDRNVRENTTRLTFTPDECRGLPDNYLQRVQRDEAGNIVVGFDYPDYVPFMTNAEDEEARRRYYIAYMNRGTDQNLGILDRIVALRRELASLYDLPSYAHYVTRRNMVENPETVQRFLSEVGAAVETAEKNELDELAQLKRELTGDPAANVERWDTSFYSEKLRRARYDVDQEALRKYFPTEKTVEWVLSVTKRLYGVDFRRASVPVWHEDVLYYDVREASDGSYIGGIYLDLYPREGKYKHAAAWPVRGVSLRTGRTPISVLVCNFDRVGLTHSEVETLFHEFGHVLHGVLSRTTYNQHSGTSVDRDFVEAPSQMYEEWARKLESLSTIREVAPEVPLIDAELAERLAGAHRFGRGMNYARQHLYASFDMALASSNPKGAMETWERLEVATPMGHVAGTAFPGTFGHIAADYAAGYYGYMWSEVLALDMLSAFGGDIMNEETGRRFRNTILARGGEEPARKIVEEFLGRPVSSEAFFKEITGRR
jgi:thimet oligopeptidase